MLAKNTIHEITRSNTKRVLSFVIETAGVTACSSLRLCGLASLRLKFVENPNDKMENVLELKPET